MHLYMGHGAKHVVLVSYNELFNNRQQIIKCVFAFLIKYSWL